MSASFKDLRVWQESMKFAVEVYRRTAQFPRHELYGLSNQLRRAAVSIPSNIAEGKGHRSDKEFRHFLFHARGSLMELETQILLAGKLQYLLAEQSKCVQGMATQVGRSLSGLINSLTESAA